MQTLIDSPVEELVRHALEPAGAEWIADESCWRIATDRGATITARPLDDWLTLEAPCAGVPGWAALASGAQPRWMR